MPRARPARRRQFCPEARRGMSRSRPRDANRRTENAGPVSAMSVGAMSSSRRDKASATTLFRPGRNSTVKSKPGQALVEEVLEAIMIRTNDELSSLQVRTPVAHGLNQPNEFPFVGSEASVSRREWPGEEGQCAGALVEHCTDARARGVALHGECPGEVWKLQDRGRGERRLERRESCVRF